MCVRVCVCVVAESNQHALVIASLLGGDDGRRSSRDKKADSDEIRRANDGFHRQFA